MQRGARYFEILIIIVFLIVLLVLPLGKFLPTIAYSQIPYLPNQQRQSSPSEKNQGAIFNGGNINNNNNNNTNKNKNKVAIITFGDAWKSEYTTAKPILDKYGFKA